jgi:hypothetical protein
MSESEHGTTTITTTTTTQPPILPPPQDAENRKAKAEAAPKDSKVKTTLLFHHCCTTIGLYTDLSEVVITLFSHSFSFYSSTMLGGCTEDEGEGCNRTKGKTKTISLLHYD